MMGNGEKKNLALSIVFFPSSSKTAIYSVYVH